MEHSDVIYGTFSIPKDITSIINTKIFQRLSRIKQVGFLSKFIPQAIHARYDHCIGTYYRAGQMLNKIELNTDWLTKIPLAYRKAVEIAALLHDLGHGPFSHCWEAIAQNYHHEENALPCIDSIFETVQGFEELRIENNFGISFIKALILGDSKLLSRPLENQYKFLFEIVNNKQCKVDVDKWDYLKRDYYYLKQYLDTVSCSIDMDFDSVFLEARASEDGAHIQYRFKDYDKIYAIFEARFLLHLNCYRMPCNVVCDQILKEIVHHHINENIDDMKLQDINANSLSAFLQLTDDKVLEIVEAEETKKQMLNITNIIPLPSNTVGEDKDVPEYMKVRTVLKAPGSEMPNDDDFSFYGNKRDMRFINCTRGNFVRNSDFRFVTQLPIRNGIKS